MKIGLIAHLKHPIAPPFKGGLEAFTYQIAERLIALGHEVMLFASSNSAKELSVVSILSDEHYDTHTGIRKKQHDLPSEYIAEHHAYYELMTNIDRYDLDVIFNNSLHYIPITMANTVRTPMVTVLHTPPFYELELAIKKEQEKPCIHYVTVSQQSAKNWSRLVKECRVITNGIDVASWEFHEKSAAERYAVWFGRIHPDKGLHLAITAARQAGIPLKIAGGIADKKYYNQYIAPLLDHSIEMLGLCSHTELNQIIGGATVALVTPTWEEPFGLVLAEAMACGTPIAGFQIGALTEVVTEGTGFLVAPGDTDALAEAIQQAEKLDRSEIRAYAEHNFEINDMVKKYEQLLEGIIAKSDLSDALKKIAAHASEADDPSRPALQEIAWLREAGALSITLPGAALDFSRNNTPELLELLKDVGQANLSIGRIYEGHINALHLVHLYATEAQRDQWYADARAGMLFGVWNTQAGDGIHLLPEGEELRLQGAKTFCSGAAMVKRALITGNIDSADRKGWQMMIIGMDKLPQEAIDHTSWKPMGMNASGSYRVDFNGYKLSDNELLAMPGTYLQQPYFNAGAIRFAAVQLGGGAAIAQHTMDYLGGLGRMDDPFQKTRLANIFTQLQTGLLWLQQAGKHFDEWCTQPDHYEDMIAYANMTRVAIEEICLTIMSDSNRCVGARGLMAPYELERLNRDLTFYLRQPAPDATRLKIAEHFIAQHNNDGPTIQ